MYKNHNELADWLLLAHHAHLNGAKAHQLLAYFGSPRAICHANPSELMRYQLSPIQITKLKKQHDNKEVVDTLRWLEKDSNHHIVTMNDSYYPSQLVHIASAPILLYVKGDPKILSYPQLAMVGSRNPSLGGLSLAKEFAYQLSINGLCITSGLALGIDGASHEGALEAGGTTIAVLGTGLQHIYPKRHNLLAETIMQAGCLISEFPLDAAPVPLHFPRRNRLISGLSIGTFVVEAALKSGSLITAQYALEQGREVFAMPGSIRNPTAQGCLELIQQGAKCVMSVNDILQEMNWISQLQSLREIQSVDVGSDGMMQTTLDPMELQVLACIENDVTTIDQICEHSKLSAQMVMVSLAALELQGCVKSCQTGYVRVKA